MRETISGRECRDLQVQCGLCRELSSFSSSNFPISVWQPHTNFDSFNIGFSFLLFEKLSAASKGCTLPDFHAGNGTAGGWLRLIQDFQMSKLSLLIFLKWLISFSIKLICSSKPCFDYVFGVVARLQMWTSHICMTVLRNGVRFVWEGKRNRNI